MLILEKIRKKDDRKIGYFDFIKKSHDDKYLDLSYQLKIRTVINKKKDHKFMQLEVLGKKDLAATYSSILLCIVPSAMRSLTSEFGMGSGISSSPLPPSKRLLQEAF